MKSRVLILCTGNSARSQMAEGLLRHLAGSQLEIESAGSKPSSVNPLAIAVMRERGIEIAHHRSKHLNEFITQPFDYVITVCDHAAESCPLFPGAAKRIHWGFPDPTDLKSFREVREAIEKQLHQWVNESLPLGANK